jgi:hypothetical protein
MPMRRRLRGARNACMREPQSARMHTWSWRWRGSRCMQMRTPVSCWRCGATFSPVAAEAATSQKRSRACDSALAAPTRLATLRSTACAAWCATAACVASRKTPTAGLKERHGQLSSARLAILLCTCMSARRLQHPARHALQTPEQKEALFERLARQSPVADWRVEGGVDARALFGKHGLQWDGPQCAAPRAPAAVSPRPRARPPLRPEASPRGARTTPRPHRSPHPRTTCHCCCEQCASAAHSTLLEQAARTWMQPAHACSRTRTQPAHAWHCCCAGGRGAHRQQAAEGGTRDGLLQMLAERAAMRVLAEHNPDAAVSAFFRLPSSMLRATLLVLAALPCGARAPAALLSAMSPVQACRCVHACIPCARPRRCSPP